MQFLLGEARAEWARFPAECERSEGGELRDEVPETLPCTGSGAPAWPSHLGAPLAPKSQEFTLC